MIVISAPPCEQLNKKSKAKQITAELNLHVQQSKLHGLFCTGKNLTAVFSSQRSNSSGIVIIVDILHYSYKNTGESFSDRHSVRIKRRLNWWKNYFPQELLSRALDGEIRLGLVGTAAGFRFLSPALKWHYQKTHFQ